MLFGVEPAPPALAGLTFVRTPSLEASEDGHHNVGVPLPVGSLAPDFTLRTMTPEGIADFHLYGHLAQENVVLLFVPGAFTPVCTGEFCRISQDLGSYRELNAVVAGISTDTVYSLDAWAKQESITMPLLSDLQRQVTRAYEVEWPDLGGMGPVAARAAFVIGRDRRVAYSEKTPTLRDLPDFESVRSALEGLRPKTG